MSWGSRGGGGDGLGGVSHRSAAGSQHGRSQDQEGQQFDFHGTSCKTNQGIIDRAPIQIVPEILPCVKGNRAVSLNSRGSRKVPISEKYAIIMEAKVGVFSLNQLKFDPILETGNGKIRGNGETLKHIYDVIIIGGGVTGCMTARALSRYQLDILLIEQASDVCTGASAANTAIVHPGYDPPPGSLKALLNVRANPMWDELAAQLHFDLERPGDYVVAIGEEELPALERLLEQGRRNGVPGMGLISADEMRRREPNINPAVSGAMWASTGGICDPFGVTIAAAENAVQQRRQAAAGDAL